MRAIATLLLAASLAACVSNKVDKDGTILTPSEANRDGLGGAVSAPLRDVNVVRTKIPPVLLNAYADAYKRPSDGCAGIVAEVSSLNESLGPDLDEPGSKDKRGLITRGKDMATDSALGMVAGTASDLIPFRSWVRRLSGAERHSRLVNGAIASGNVRRAYLKGLGESRGCNPPATPQHKAEPAEVIQQQRGPRYPID